MATIQEMLRESYPPDYDWDEFIKRPVHEDMACVFVETNYEFQDGVPVALPIWPLQYEWTLFDDWMKAIRPQVGKRQRYLIQMRFCGYRLLREIGDAEVFERCALNGTNEQYLWLVTTSDCSYWISHGPDLHRVEAVQAARETNQALQRLKGDS
jgi:hypothetical protein